MEVVEVMSIIMDAKLVLARIERAHEPKKQCLIGLDAYYVTLLERARLPGSTLTPNRCLTKELLADMAVQTPDLQFTACRSVGVYFGKFRELGTVPWRTPGANGWQFGRLITLRQAWELQMGGWNWPNANQDWTWNPHNR
jgi:hypothetical protein